MRVTMVSKRFSNGDVCPRCVEAEATLERRGLRHRIDDVDVRLEDTPNSDGALLAEKHGMHHPPFFIVHHEDGREQPVASVQEVVSLMAQVNNQPRALDPLGEQEELRQAQTDLSQASPQEILSWALTRFGADCVLTFSGAEDVVLLDMAARTGLEFSVLSIDTGRLHPETLDYLEQIRTYFGVNIRVLFPDTVAVERLVRAKGLMSFYTDGHTECCRIRKVEPLQRALRDYRAWVTGQRRDQSATRSELRVLEVEEPLEPGVGPVAKLNPLANWSTAETWSYMRQYGIPYNQLHDRGYLSIGCAPCTRAIRPGEQERAGRWWWEQETQRECGIHTLRRSNANLGS